MSIKACAVLSFTILISRVLRFPSATKSAMRFMSWLVS
ncbi:hypothetical protein BMETH_518_1 [methanotrophic bacterial endosymbiont of Bathymodiolus sp.]|nr:hypothetical protein BMETH_518_1 [methanotrophic bacterial endosymbiont of Bathymodiolus sp.]